ncbi:MAG: hypothetical protein RMY35_022595 [Nostoc sp. DedSLP01]|nr:hypothetical protein [Nostoc sp. DedSLP05]
MLVGYEGERSDSPFLLNSGVVRSLICYDFVASTTVGNQIHQCFKEIQ